jgi:hypothetical protein
MTRPLLNVRRRFFVEELEPKYCPAEIFGTGRLVNTPADVYALADADGDGDVDVFAGASWYENTDGKGTFGNPQPVGGSGFVADVDGDGDVDVLAAGSGAWYENTDGKGTFGNEHVIGRIPGALYVADVDGDGDIDVFSGSSTRLPGPLPYFDTLIAWHVNIDGKGTFAPRIVATIKHEHSVIQSIHAADVDGDGDVDVLSAASYAPVGTVYWYENRNGKGSFGNPRSVGGLPGVSHVRAADMDGDGDLDVLYNGNEFVLAHGINWSENMDGKGSFGSGHTIDAEFVVDSFDVIDVDGDGDVDVLSAAFGGTAWYENTDGSGRVWGRQDKAFVSGYLFPADLDGDGDGDVLVGNVWYENLTRRRLVGDSNGDGMFNSTDLILVFQAGKYEDGIAKNDTFEEGDWNGDGEFDSSDLVLAFQEGHYVAAARPAADRIFAAIDWPFATDRERRNQHHSLGAIILEDKFNDPVITKL